MINTVSLQIGNSDHKLSQNDWSWFVSETDKLVIANSMQVHFSGFSEGGKPWQNACWVFNTDDIRLSHFLNQMPILRARYRQDSVAVVVGSVSLI